MKLAALGFLLLITAVCNAVFQLPRAPGHSAASPAPLVPSAQSLLPRPVLTGPSIVSYPDSEERVAAAPDWLVSGGPSAIPGSAGSERVLSSQCPSLGEGYCLISRIDVVPCTFPRRSTTRRPGPNECGIYLTKYISGAGGCPRCMILKRNHRIYDIPSIGSIKFLFSPSMERNPPQNYPNKLYVDYNIDCGNGNQAFLSIFLCNLEGRTCADPNDNNKLKCVDYIQIQKKGHWSRIEICGKDRTKLVIDGSSRIVFRSNHKHRFPGFKATVICFDPSLRNSHGCTNEGSSGKRSRRLAQGIQDPSLHYLQPLSHEEEGIFDRLTDRETYRETPDRETPSFDLSISDANILLAARNKNACNPILKSLSNSIIEGTDPTRLEELTNPGGPKSLTPVAFLHEQQWIEREDRGEY